MQQAHIPHTVMEEQYPKFIHSVDYVRVLLLQLVMCANRM